MEFLDYFNSNKQYMFDKDIYFEWKDEEVSENPELEEIWTNACNNKKIEILKEDIGKIEVYTKNNVKIIYNIVPEWCREIPSPVRMLTDKDL